MAEDDCGADQFLSTTHMVRGFHVACLDLDHGSGNVSVTVFQNGRRSVNQTLVLGREEASTHTFRVSFCEPIPTLAAATSSHSGRAKMIDGWILFGAVWCRPESIRFGMSQQYPT